MECQSMIDCMIATVFMLLIMLAVSRNRIIDHLLWICKWGGTICK